MVIGRGANTLSSNRQCSNVVVGYQAGYRTCCDNRWNILIGYQAGWCINKPPCYRENIIIGARAGFNAGASTSANSVRCSIMIGPSAGNFSCCCSVESINIGYVAGRNNIKQYNVIAIGGYALRGLRVWTYS